MIICSIGLGQTSIEINPKCLQKVATEFIKNHLMELIFFSTDWLSNWLTDQPSDKRNLITAKAMGLGFLLFDVVCCVSCVT